jgi:hypothetical protein
MAGGPTRLAAACLLALGGLVFHPQAARALEAFDGQVQLHGFVEEQLRALSGSFNEEVDLAQWYNVLNLELELDIAPSGFGPIDLLQAYIRVEARYDCIYSHGCGMLQSVNTYGNDAKRLPQRLRDARDQDYGGVIKTGGDLNPQEVPRIQNERPQNWAILQVIPNEPLGGSNPALWTPEQALFNQTWIKDGDGDGVNGYNPANPDRPGNRPMITIVRDREGFPGFDTLFKTRGADAELAENPGYRSLYDPSMIEPYNDDPAVYTFEPVEDYVWTFRSKLGPDGGAGRTLVMGPWLPKNYIRTLGTLHDRANPFRGITPPTRYNLPPGSPNGQTNRVPMSRTTNLPPAMGPSMAIYPTANTPTDAIPGVGDTPDPRILAFFLNPTQGYDGELALPNFLFPRVQTNLGARLDGTGFGGDFSGIVPNFSPELGPSSAAQRQINGTFAPAQGVFPLTNIRATGGVTELPLRPAPDVGNLAEFDPQVAKGLYIPSMNLRRELREQDLDPHNFNIKENHRAWNRGQSQDEWKEVKEAYIDVEVLDSRLWGRFGIQNIVWGKTELFRTTDQFNPQDLALASLASLEESRIALLAGRLVYSLYDVGPLEDVRLEFAFNFDEYKPADLGACGESFTPDLVCGLTAGLFFHGLTGIGIAGVDRPPDPWDSLKGLEIGGRIEWRWDRFSFALMDFWGYHDFPYPDTINYYERNVDPETGRPRIAGSTGMCRNTGAFQFFIFGAWSTVSYANPTVNQPMQGGLGLGVDPDCLKAGGAAGGINANLWDPADYEALLAHYADPSNPLPVLYDNPDPLNNSPQNALENHHANQQLFAFICSGTVTIAASVDPGACAWSIFGTAQPLSQAAPFLALSEVLTAVFAGEHNATAQGYFTTFTQNTKGLPTQYTPVRNLNDDFNDGIITALNPEINPPGTAMDFLTLDQTLTNEQRALLGCGPFYGTRCDSGRGGFATSPFSPQTINYQGQGWPNGGGLDVLNAEAGVILQSFPGTPGTRDGWLTTNRELGPQPGTIGFEGAPLCTRYVNKQMMILPGCRGVQTLTLDTVANVYRAVFDNGYNVAQDGCVFGTQTGMGAFVRLNGRAIVATHEDGSPVDLARCGTSLGSTTTTGGRTRQAPNQGVPTVAHPLGESGYGSPTAVPPNATAVVSGSRTLFHPLAGCLTAAQANSTVATDRVCNFQTRNFDVEYGLGTAQIFRNELAAVSWNLLMFLVTAGSCDSKERSIQLDSECFNPGDAWRADKCSFAAPQYCGSVKGFLGVGGQNSPKRVAGGNGQHGRHDFLWHSGGELVLRYAKRNVFGLSTDFAEDVSKTNWGVEFTYMGEVPYVDNGDYGNGVTGSDSVNLTISVDRPTFINFLNPNRTFFFNTQWFFQYLPGYKDTFTVNGPFNVLFTFAMFTGYYQDRLLPTLITVYDFNSRSGGLLPSITYRFNESFSVTTGVNLFWGRGQYKDMQVRAWAPTSNRAGKHAYDDGVENVLSVINRRDEVFLRLRYTF